MKRNNYSNIDITGHRFGKLTAIKKAEGTKSKWLFKCDCGKEIELPYSRIIYGQLSCGCFRKECMKSFGQSHKTHGESRTKLYRKYKSIIRRCYDKTARNYDRYGGRGITVCDEWLCSFEAFRDWALSTGYDPNKEPKEQSIDRIDNDGNYCPENCKWSTASEQQKNRKTTTLYPFENEMYSASEFANKFGITDKSFVYRRLKVNHQTLEYILDDWIKIHNVPDDLIEVEDYAKEHGVHTATIRRWINQGKIQGEKVGRKWYVKKQE